LCNVGRNWRFTNILGVSGRRLFDPFILGGDFGGRLVVDYAWGEI